MHQESGGEDIAGAGGIHLVGEIGGEALGHAMLEERGPVSPVGGNEQRDLHAPTGQDGISTGAVAGGERKQVIVAENEYIQKRQYFFSGRPWSRPDASIIIPAA